MVEKDKLDSGNLPEVDAVDFSEGDIPNFKPTQPRFEGHFHFTFPKMVTESKRAGLPPQAPDWVKGMVYPGAGFKTGAGLLGKRAGLGPVYT